MNNIDLFFNKVEEIEKKAYPNFAYKDPQPLFDLNKWVLSMQKIAHMQKNGYDKFSAVNQVTNGWSVNELDNFINWMKFYESGDHLKYKYASLYSSNPGYYIHLDKEKNEYKSDFNKADDSDEEVEVDDRDERLKTFKKKFVSRLNSIEKLLSSQDGQEFLSNDSDELINIIFDIKKKVTKLKVASYYSIHDEIIRVANKNKSNTFNYDFLIKLAQTASPNPSPPNPPAQPSGSPAGMPAYDSVGNMPPPNNPPADIGDGAKDEGAKEFVDKLKGVKDDNDSDTEEYLFVSEAQEIPPTPAEDLTKAPEQKLPNTNVAISVNDYDNAVDQIFKNVKIEDVVVKLDSLANIFKEREIPRQLSLVDMMLNALNLSQMFPGLSEALNKSLESNNYILTRVDDIISKLRGSIKSNQIDLNPKENTSADPQAAAIKQNIQQEEEADKKRKEMRKQVENEALEKMNKAPEIEVSDIPAPANVQETPQPVKAQ